MTRRYVIIGGVAIGAHLAGQLTLAGLDAALVARGAQLDKLRTARPNRRGPDHGRRVPGRGPVADGRHSRARHYLGVDVGTGSARAGVFDMTGCMLASAKRDIHLHQVGADIAEQSSDNIWLSVAAAVREAFGRIDDAPRRIVGIGFDATCSLVVLDATGGPVTVSATGEADRNIIVWMDDRATVQAERINQTRHPVLSYVGGAISPEMETPKLLWLAENMPIAFEAQDTFSISQTI